MSEDGVLVPVQFVGGIILDETCSHDPLEEVGGPPMGVEKVMVNLGFWLTTSESSMELSTT